MTISIHISIIDLEHLCLNKIIIKGEAMKSKNNINFFQNLFSSKLLKNEAKNCNRKVDVKTIPQPLMQYVFKLCIGAFLCFVVSITSAITCSSIMPLILLGGTALFVFKIYVLFCNYQQGNIEEIAVICTGLKASRIRDRVTVTFREVNDTEELQRCFKFIIPSKKTQDEFIVNSSYLIYFDKNNIDILLAWANI